MLRRIDQSLLSLLYHLQEWMKLAIQGFSRMVRPPWHYRETITQFDKLGYSSLFICTLTGLFSGMVMALQALIQLKPFAATSYVGGMVAVTMIKELGPVLAALMVTGRAGSAITAELGSMVVSEQIDAIRVEGSDVVQRLVSPRLKALLCAMPLLTVMTDACAVLGGYLIAIEYGMSPTMYLSTFTQFMVPLDYLEGGLVKPLVFASIFCITSCYAGLTTTGGAAGVGAATKRAVVVSSIAILMSDFFIAKLFVLIR